MAEDQVLPFVLVFNGSKQMVQENISLRIPKPNRVGRFIEVCMSNKLALIVAEGCEARGGFQSDKYGVVFPADETSPDGLVFMINLSRSHGGDGGAAIKTRMMGVVNRCGGLWRPERRVHGRRPGLQCVSSPRPRSR